MPHRLPLIAALVFTSLIGGAAVFGLVQLATSNLPTPTPTYDPYTGITRFAEPRPMPDFTLTDQNGNEFQLSSLRGKHALLFFGFTHCPDICPLTVAETQQIQRRLGDQADEFRFVFISVDGNRDTPAVLNTFLAVRNATDFIGLTGDPETVRTIAAAYNAVFEYGAQDANGNYSVAHTPKVFVLNPAGAWIMEYQFGADLLLVVEVLQGYLTDG